MSEIDHVSNGENNPAPANADDLPFALPIDLVINDAEVIAAICERPEGELREHFVQRALRVGVLALRHAVSEVDSDRIRRETDRMLGILNRQLDDHGRGVHERVTDILKRYFDPESGQFSDRVERLIKRDGELEQLLMRQVGQQDSELSKTLASHFGQESSLLKWLNPDKSRGFLAELEKALAEQLTVQRDSVIKQFSLDNKEGALCRFMNELTERQGTLSKDLKGQISDVVKQFSLDDESSALSRLVASVTKAERRMASEFSLDEEGSALARLKRELLKPLKEQQQSSRDFQEEVKLALKELTTRRDEAAAGTRHGLEYEDGVAQQIEFESHKLGDIPTRTGNTTGSIKNCKIGDVVVELGPDNAAAGARIAVEAKEDASYTVEKARDEIEKARKNRNAQAGLFVFSTKTAPPGVETVTRYGNDVLIVWDLENTQTDLFLRVGLTLARALCIRQRTHTAAEAADFSAIKEAILEIEKQAGKLGDIDTWTKTIESSCQKIRQRLESARKSTERQVGVLNDRIEDLKQLASEVPSE